MQTVDTIDTQRKYIPIEEIIDFTEKGLTYEQVGKQFGISKQAVHQRLKKAEYTPQRILNYRQHKAKVIDYYQSLFLNSLTPDDIKEMSGRDKIISWGVLYDKGRTEAGQSNVNVSLHSVMSDLETKAQDSQQRLSELLAMRQQAQDVVCDSVHNSTKTSKPNNNNELSDD